MRSQKTLEALARVVIGCCLLSSCGGASKSNFSPQVVSPHLISASAISFTTGVVLPGFVSSTSNTSVSVQIQDTSSGGASVADAVVSANGVQLAYSAANQDYEGEITLAPGGTFSLRVAVAGAIYTASAGQFASYPFMDPPFAGANWSSLTSNQVKWSGGSPAANSILVLGIVDSTDPNGPLVWPSGGSFQEVPPGAGSFTFDPNSISVGSRSVVVGITTVVPIPGAAPNSGIVLGGFSYKSITVTATDAAPTAPVDPPPAGLWQPAPGSTPATGNYVYLQSDPSDFVGRGETLTYTPSNAALVAFRPTGLHFGLSVSGSTSSWVGEFQGMSTVSRLGVGFYPGVDFGLNSALPTFSWGGDGRSCGEVLGWFVVDSIAYDTNDNITAIDLRFEQHCSPVIPALRGAIHWVGS